ncbi:S-adenosyl-L-methionine-dependent methyltransferase [Mycotypha africana]|uniref:S-adenosyl-L-methionine-dependent methyltransferase n=1 Tax=Mycotypha africana TaxID=64632 RepID=UPI002301F258|nr:S-adenosyl-L-methionine-dependent methyltransferase [Mycotypha africana]KAI8981870.1 S-adenosyl-L-methionine-dependent methyltransferase [Mycotypha africana]
MSNEIEQLKVIQNEPFLKFVEDSLTETFYSKSNDKVVRLLEIGCGPGDFAILLKQKLGSKVEYHAIDPSDDIEQAKAKASTIGVDIQFSKTLIFDFKSEFKFDIVMFTKSLHHCNPIEKAVKIAYDLLNSGGILIAEEIRLEYVNEFSASWFFDRLDLLRAAGLFTPADERMKTIGHASKMFTRMLDQSLPAMERWFRPHGHHHEVHDHSHSDCHEHHHPEGEHNHKHKQPLHRDDPEGIATSDEVTTVIRKQFGEDATKTMLVSCFRMFFVFVGLKNTEAGQAVLKELMKQEERDIAAKRLVPFGLNIVAYKN